MNIFIKLLVAHMIADYPLQTDWMAVNKMHLKNPAGYLHACFHGVMAYLFTGSIIAAAITMLTHWIIDLRFITGWIAKVKGMSRDNPLFGVVQLMTDQTLHIVAMYLIAYGLPA